MFCYDHLHPFATVLSGLLSPPCGSVQEARQADGFSEDLHEVAAHQTEAEAAWHPQGARVRLRPWRAPAKLWTRWYETMITDNQFLKCIENGVLDL